MKKKCIVMLSGGLDSRLALKIMQEKGFDVVALHFKLPFSKDVEKEINKFAREQKVKLEIFDYTKGKLLKEYLELIKKPCFGTGSGINPCIDCRLFILKKAKQYADKHKIKLIASGEVLGQRPMSQHKKGLDIVEKKSGLNKRLIRPLIEKGISGRKREKQIELAGKFRINYPNPAGGCLLCEKNLMSRFKFLLKRGIKDQELILLNTGRHFVIENSWIVLGRNEKENKIIEKIGNKNNLILPKEIGPSAIILGKPTKKLKDKVKKLIEAYSKGHDPKEREKLRKYSL